MTEVDLAVRFALYESDRLLDAMLRMLGDCSLPGLVVTVTSRFPAESGIDAFQSRREPERLREEAKGLFAIGRDKLRNSLQPDEVLSR